MIEFTRYVALGDSMSIDLYPALDAGRDRRRGRARARSRRPDALRRSAPRRCYIRTLTTAGPTTSATISCRAIRGSTFQNLATDGATIGEVFGEQLPQIDDTDEPTLVTLTIGGNDLLSAYGNRPRKRSLLERIERDVAEAYDFLVDTLRGRAVRTATIVIATVYDPSDRHADAFPACTMTPARCRSTFSTA